MIQFNVTIVLFSRASNVARIGIIVRERARHADYVAQFSKKEKLTLGLRTLCSHSNSNAWQKDVKKLSPTAIHKSIKRDVNLNLAFFVFSTVATKSITKAKVKFILTW
jgi:hypothetical protein